MKQKVKSIFKVVGSVFSVTVKNGNKILVE
jgi:hypothetical protein